jgi:hypothetical protein
MLDIGQIISSHCRKSGKNCFGIFGMKNRHPGTEQDVLGYSEAFEILE